MNVLKISAIAAAILLLLASQAKANPTWCGGPGTARYAIGTTMCFFGSTEFARWERICTAQQGPGDGGVWVATGRRCL